MDSVVTTPDGSTIYPRDSIKIGNGIILHQERWHLYIETPAGWFVASADSLYRDFADGLWFGSWDEFVTVEGEAENG